MTSVACSFLGPAEIRVAGRAPPPQLLWRKNVGMLAYLACSPNRRRTREQLVGLLWPDKPESSARQSLREAIRILRRSLGADAVHADGDVVELRMDDLDLDLDHFRLLATTNPDGAADLVRGEFLEGFSIPGAAEFEQWLSAERLEWRRHAVDALINAATNRLNSGDIDTAYAHASQALRLDPGSDVAAQASMRCLAIAGNGHAALEVFDRFHAYMHDLGAVPHEQTKALAGRIKQGRFGSAAPSAGADVQSSRRPPLVGRTAETVQIFELWETCKRGEGPTIVLVEGDAGVGKTRLAAELINRARLDGAVVASVRGVRSDRDAAESGLRGLAAGGLSNASGVRAADPGALATVARCVRSWADAFPETKAHDGQMSLPDALTDIIGSIAEEEPVCLCVDDAHWFDGKTLNWLHAVMRDLPSARILLWVNVTASHSCEQIDELRKRIGHELTGLRVSLTPFEHGDVLALVEHTMPDYTPEQRERLARRIMVDSGGIPLLAVEILHAVQCGLELDDGPDVWPTSKRTLSQSLPSDLPDAAVAAIRVGFRTLSKDAQDVLRVVAVLGDVVRAEAISRALDLQQRKLDSALDELEWARWLESDGRGYGFVARIVRNVVREDMMTAGQAQRIRDKALVRTDD